MKKFFSFFYMIIAVIFLAVAYFTGFFNPKNLMSSVNAQSEITHTVNFYGSDNETVIYSVDVPEGKSLQDIENYFFNDTTLNNVTFSPSSGVFYDLNFNQYSGFNISWTSNSYANINLFGNNPLIPANNFVNFVYPASILPYIRQIFFYGTHDGVTKYVSNYISYSDEKIIIRTFYNLDTTFTYQHLGIQLLQDGGSFDFPFVGFTYSNYIGFFTTNYVNQLYINSGGNSVSSWSTSSEYYKKFDFNESITKDINLYANIERNFSEKEISLDVISKSNVISNTSLNSVKNLHVQGDLKREVNITNLTSSNFLTASLSSSATTTIKTLNYFSIDIVDSSTLNSINLVFESDTPFAVISNSNTFSISADENTTFKLSIGVSGFPDTSQQIFQSIETFNFTSNLTNFENFLNLFASNNYKFITNHNFAEIPFNYFQGFQNNQAEDLNLNGSLTLTLRYFENGSLTRQNYNVSSVHTKTTGFSFEVPLISASGVRVLFESYEFINGSTFVLNTESNLILNNIDSVFYTLIDYESNLEYNLTFDNSENSQDSNYLLFYNSDLNKKDYQLTTFLIDFNENFEFNVNNLTSNSFDLNIPFTINSIYYRAPLNTSKELDKFNFKVPEYLSTDIEFSLSPLKLDIPFSNYIYNFIIYLLFYAPLLSDVVYLIYLVIQTLIKCFNLVISFFVGVSSNFFIVILLGFIILNFVLKFTLGGRDG